MPPFSELERAQLDGLSAIEDELYQQRLVLVRIAEALQQSANMLDRIYSMGITVRSDRA